MKNRLTLLPKDIIEYILDMAYGQAHLNILYGGKEGFMRLIEDTEHPSISLFNSQYATLVVRPREYIHTYLDESDKFVTVLRT